MPEENTQYPAISEEKLTAFTEHARTVVRRAFLRHGKKPCKADVEDLAQDALTVLIVESNKTGTGPTTKGLSDIVFASVDAFLRKQRKRQKVERADHAGDHADDIYVQAEKEEMLDELSRLVMSLPWKKRQIIVLEYLEQLTRDEAADAAGIGKRLASS